MSLPKTIQRIVALVGHAKAMTIVAELGGQNFRVPAMKAGANWEALVELIGERAATTLLAEYRGTEIYISICTNALKLDRHRRIINRYDSLLAAGHSSRGAVSVLVTEFRPVSYRTVERIVNGPMPDQAPLVETQGSLF